MVLFLYMRLPKDDNNIAIQLTPPGAALARTVDATVSATTEVTLNAATTFVRVYAIAKDLYFKWGTADVTASNFDEVIPAGNMLDLTVPIEVATGVKYTALNVIEREAGATAIIIEK